MFGLCKVSKETFGGPPLLDCRYKALDHPKRFFSGVAQEGSGCGKARGSRDSPGHA